MTCGPSRSPETVTHSARDSTWTRTAIGADVDEPNDDASAERDDATDHLSLLMRVECEKPVLAGVNGVAVGIGLSLAMNADIRIAAPSARFHPGYARVATSPDGGLTWTLTRAVGYERAMRFLLEQRMLSAPEAHALGLVSEITETDDQFEQRFLDYGQMLAKRRATRGPPDQAASRSRRSAARSGDASRRRDRPCAPWTRLERQQGGHSSNGLQGTA